MKLLVAIMLMPLMALSATWTDPGTGITWSYIVSNGKATVTSGSSTTTPAISKSTAGAITIPSALGGYTVECVGNYAFYNCNALTAVTIPSSITSIGSSAFTGCSGLTSMTIPSSVTSIGSSAFYGCSGLTRVDVTDLAKWCEISFGNESANPLYYANHLYLADEEVGELVVPNGVTRVGAHAFSGCIGLTSVTMPLSVTAIGLSAFSGCSGLNRVDVADLAKWCEISFGNESANPLYYANHLYLADEEVGELVVPSGVTRVGSYAFSGCIGLTSVEVPSSVTNIGSGAFARCTALMSMTLPFVGSERGISGTSKSLFGYIFGQTACDGTTETKQYYQSGGYEVTRYVPSSLKSVVISDETVIGYGAFYDCRRIASVSICGGVTTINEYAFRNCSMLSEISIPASVASVDYRAFDGCRNIRSATVPGWKCGIDHVSSVTNFVIADGTTCIKDSGFKDCSGITSMTIPSSVTSIGSSAFSGCTGLESVTIPTSVTSIGSSAFSGCSGLMSVTIPSSVTDIQSSVFSGCGGLTSVTIPEGVTSIGGWAFSGCSGLTSVTIPDSVTSIGGGAFSGCSGLTHLTLPFVGSKRGAKDSRHLFGYIFGATSYAGATAVKQIYEYSSYYGEFDSSTYYIPSSLKSVAITDETKIGYGAFSYCSGLMSVTISESVASIEGYAFSGCSGLTSVTIPNGVTSIGSCAFYNCSGLTSITIPSSVTSIGGNVFYGCNSIRSVVAPGLQCGISSSSVTNLVIAEGVKSIESSAFLGWSGLTSVTIPDGVMTIEDLAFSGCSGLASVAIPMSVTSIGSDAFAGCTGLGDGIVVRDGWILCVNGECPERVVIPEGVRVIAGGTFRDRYDLVSVTLPSTLEAIGAEAFRGCTSLEYVELPEGLECVGGGAFRDCTWMQEVEFPSSLTNIGKMAFANCTMLDGVECFDGLQSVGEGAFSNCWRMLSVALPVTVDEIGDRAFYNCKSILGASVPAHVDTIAHLFPSAYQILPSVEIAEGEKELAAGFFSGCKMLREIALSNAIQEIPDSTFEGCSELLWILAPSELVRIGNRAFYGCGKLTSMELGNKGDSPFYGMGRVTVFEFSDKLTEIGDDAFNGVPKILGIECPASVKKIGARAFKGVWDDAEIKLPEGLESLGVDAFADCPSIRKVSLPAVETPIKSAFSAAYSKIESVKILGAPEVIAKDFCRDVAKLTAIEIPASVTNIGSYAFSGLSNLAAVELPQSVESVGSRAFYGCSNVRSVSCSGELDALSTLFPSAYGQITTVSINEGTTQLTADLLSGCTKLSKLDLPTGISKFGARAFKNCTALAAFGVPNGVVALGDEVFYGCTGLTSLSLPEGLESIPSGAFQNCRAISSLVIPASVNYIGTNAFSGCTALKSVSYLGSCPEFDSACYSGTPSDLSSYVVFGSRGWDGIPTSRTLPESWPTANARAITYWEPNTFEATFDGNGGTPSASVVVQTTGMTYALPEENPEMLGARFDGWWTQPVNGGRIKSTTKVEVTRAQTFYAHWKYNGYSVRFDANGGIGEMEGQVMTVNTPAELAPNRYLRKGYRFEGWALSPDGEVAFADGEEVENLSFEYNAVVPLYAVWAEQPWDAADYLNAPGRAFAFVGDAEWVADDEISHDGIGSMRSGVIAAADEGEKTTSIMQTTVVGTGSGSFWWKVDCEPADGSDYFDYCAFFVDGAEVAKIAGTEDWGKVDYVVTGEGEHVLRWVFTRDDWDEDESLYENAAWVDEFEWTPTPVTLSFDAGGADGEVPASVTKYAGYEMPLPSPSMLTKDGMVFVGWSDGVSVFRSGDAYTFGSVDVVLCAVWEEKTWTLEEAANLTGLTVFTGGNANWTVDLDKNYDGVASIRSGVIGDDQQTWISLDVEGPGTVAFRTFVSGEFYRGKKCDYLKFEVDGAEEFSSHDANWSNVVVKVSGRGKHTLKWTYLKNASRSAGDDCAWLDEIVWVSDAETAVMPTIAELADVFGAESDVVKGIKDEAQLAAFNQFLKDCAIASASDLSAGQKTWAYQSFKLSEVMTAPQLFEEEPVLKFDNIELNDGNLALTVSLCAGAEAITLAKDKLAEKIRVGTSLDGIAETPQIVASPSADGASLTFTIAPPQGEKGFVRILID